MNESQGTVKIASMLRTAYMECDNGIDFVRYCYRVFDMTDFSASLCFEVIDVVGDLGVTPDAPPANNLIRDESSHTLRDHARFVEARCPDGAAVAGDMRAAAEEIRQLRMALEKIKAKE